MNINDIANATQPHDPGFIYTGIFDSNRWTPAGGKIIPAIGGAFDPATGRLYVLGGGVSFNQYESQFVVSVYQVGGV